MSKIWSIPCLYKSRAQKLPFWTTSQFNGNVNGLYLRNETRYRQSVKCIDKGSSTSYIHFLRWRPRHRNSSSGFSFRESAHLGRSKSTCTPNFSEISQSTAEILLLPVSENKRPPCWNSTSSSNFYVCITIGMSFCICVPNFVYIGQCATELWRRIHFSRWWPSAILSYADHRRSANEGLRSVPKFRLDRIYSFGDIAIFVLWAYSLEIAYLRRACAGWRVNLLPG